GTPRDEARPELRSAHAHASRRRYVTSMPVTSSRTNRCVATASARLLTNLLAAGDVVTRASGPPGARRANARRPVALRAPSPLPRGHGARPAHVGAHRRRLLAGHVLERNPRSARGARPGAQRVTPPVFPRFARPRLGRVTGVVTRALRARVAPLALRGPG